MRRHRVAQFGALAAIVAAPTLSADVWLNETGVTGEMDYVAIQWPSSLTLNVGQTENVYGRVYEAGVTDQSGAHASILAQWGYGPEGSDPRITAWTWLNASFNSGYLGTQDDEYYIAASVPMAGVYSYTFRYSQDSAASWTLADLDGAGSNTGADFSTSQLAPMTVVPEPAACAALIASLALLRRRRRVIAPRR